MIGREEKQRLVEAYRDAGATRGLVVRAIAGLVIILTMASVGVAVAPDAPVASVSARPGATDR